MFKVSGSEMTALELAHEVIDAGNNTSIVVSHYRIKTLAKEIIRLTEALREIKGLVKQMDQWQANVVCDSSAYTMSDDDFGELQYLMHAALGELNKLIK